MKLTLSVVLSTFNEETNVDACLESVRDWVDEIIVVDGSSTDKTREIAKNYGAKVIVTKNRPMFHTNKQMAIDEAKGDWVLQIDADERITLELKEEIVSSIPGLAKRSGAGKYQVSSIDQPVAYYIKRKTLFMGRWMRGAGLWPDPVIRLFKRGNARLPQKSVHEQMEVDGPVGMLKNPMEHHTAPNFSRYFTNANRYTTLTAFDYQKQDITITPWTVFLYMYWKPRIHFLSLYLRHKGFRDGFPGFVWAIFSGLHPMIAFLKYWEMRKNEKARNVMRYWV